MSSESFELRNETARKMIRAVAIVLTTTAVLGAMTLPLMPTPAGPAALAATLIGTSVAWWQTTRPNPDAFGLLLIWVALTALSGSFAEGPVANAQTMSLLVAVFLGVFLLDGRRMWIVLGLASVAWGWMMTRVAPGLDRDTVSQIAVNHAITFVMGTGLMLTLRRRMRYVINRAVDRFHGLPVGAFRTTADGTILEANSRFISILDYESAEDLMARNVSDFFVDKDAHTALVGQAIRDGAVQGAHLSLATKSGRTIEARCTLSFTVDSAGKPTIEGAIEDVTALRMATRRARMAEERFTAAFESAPIGMLMVRVDGSVLKANDAVKRLLGFHCHHLNMRTWDELGDGSPEWATLIADQGGEEHEHLVRRADGTELWVRASATKLEDDDGPFFAIQLVDVTSQRTLAESLRATVKAKDEFVASVSHELRTPLTAVLGFSEMLIQDDGLDGDERAAMQRLVHSQALSVSHIVDDLLVAARVSNGRLSVNPRPIDLESVTKRAVADCTHAVGCKTTPHIDGHAQAWADPERVRQILRNLVTNASRYGGERINVEISNGAAVARVAVIDNGTGIEAAAVDSIWEPYSRAHPDSPTTTDPIGLGLAVSRHLAALMDGDLQYHYEDGNSVFELTLPAVKTTAAP